MPHDDLIAKAREQAKRLRARDADHQRVGAQRVAGLRSELIDRYEFQGELHRGGQGVVYRAVQRGADRAVAIKVLHGGVLGLQTGPISPTAQARFEREIRILAGIRHPNIVAIHDSGTAGGAFFYVMDLVEGRPLDAYVRDNQLDLHATLELFIKVAEAVHAAHLRGVIHRDLKPGNILVTDAGEPIVLDFGLAKLAEDEDNSSAAAAMTRTGQFLGSLPWASPEQAEGLQADLDLRSDVYSLGVLLFGALTGEFPYAVDGNTRTVLTNIVEATPPRPSQLRSDVTTDLDTIVLKCLSKDAVRRYQTSGELAADLRRYLAGDAIDARRDSTSYMLRMQLRRHRGAVLVGVGFVVITLAGLVTSLAFWRQAVDQREVARAEAQAAAEAAERAEAVTTFLTDMLTAVEPDRAMENRDITVREVLDQAAEDADQFPDQPELEATVRTAIGQAYTAVGALQSAESQLRRALELSTTSELEVRSMRRNALATALQERGNLPEAIELFRQAREELRESGVADGMSHFMANNNLAIALLQGGQGEEAGPLLESLLEEIGDTIPEESEEAAQLYSNFGGFMIQQKDFPEAERYWRDALAVREQVLPENHPSIVESLNNLGMLLTETRQLEEAETMLRRALAIDQRIREPDNPQLAFPLNNLANLLDAQGRHEDAEELHRQALELRIEQLGPKHGLTTATRCNLALNLRMQGRLPEARTQAELAMEGDWASGPDTGPREMLEFFLAITLAELGEMDAARAMLKDLPERLTALGLTEPGGQAAMMREQLQP